MLRVKDPGDEAMEFIRKPFMVDLVFPTTMREGAFKGVLRIRTDNKNAPVVEQPVSGTISKPPAGGSSAGR